MSLHSIKIARHTSRINGAIARYINPWSPLAIEISSKVRFTISMVVMHNVQEEILFCLEDIRGCYNW